MNLCILYNRDAELLENDPGREAREDVTRVAGALAEALGSSGYDVQLLGVGSDPIAFVEALRKNPPALVLNLCESLAGDSRGEMAVPCLLDLLGIPYTGSPALSLGIALHKNKAKDLLRGAGVRTPEYWVMHRVEDALTPDLPFPLIVKPAREDASVGIEFDSVVRDRDALARAVGRILQTFQQPALVERYIAGREIYVPILGNDPRGALPLTEIHFGKAFENRPNIVSYKAKWEADSSEYQDSPSGPCSLDPQIENRVVATALAAFEALDIRDYGRVDIRLSPEGEPYVIDINPNCDLHPDAGFARSAKAAGISYPALARRLVEIALGRTHGNPADQSGRQGAVGSAAREGGELHPGGGVLRAGADRHRAAGD